MSLLSELLSINEGAVKNRIAELHDAIVNELDADDDMADKIVDYLLNNADDSEVDDFLYNHFEGEMPYGTAKARTGDPKNWIAHEMEMMFRKYTKGL